MKTGYSRVIAYSSIFGALALSLSVSGLSTILAYPPAPFLKFDVSEVIDVIALFLGGYTVAFITTLIHGLGLIIITGDVLGPAMKFLAVISMFPGFYISNILARRVNLSGRMEYLLGSFFAINLRWIIMSIANIVVLLYIAPQYLTIFMPSSSVNIIEQGKGGNVILVQSEDIVVNALLTALGIIASYNIIHGIITLALSISIYNVVRRHLSI